MDIRNVVECPPLSDSDIGPGPDHLDSRGWGDRGNLGCWAAAELRQSGDLKAVFEDCQGYRNQAGGPVWGSESPSCVLGQEEGGLYRRIRCCWLRKVRTEFAIIEDFHRSGRGSFYGSLGLFRDGTRI